MGDGRCSRDIFEREFNAAATFSAGPSGPYQNTPASRPLFFYLGRQEVEKGAIDLLFQPDNEKSLTEQMPCPASQEVFWDRRFSAEAVAGILHRYNAKADIRKLQALLKGVAR
jgi:hypothetical protein